MSDPGIKKRFTILVKNPRLISTFIKIAYIIAVKFQYRLISKLRNFLIYRS